MSEDVIRAFYYAIFSQIRKLWGFAVYDNLRAEIDKIMVYMPGSEILTNFSAKNFKSGISFIKFK